MHKKTVIGVSGFARSGKDVLSSLLLKKLAASGIKAKTFSFASNLKADINNFFLSKLDISAFTEDKEMKEKIRPLLIAYGNLQRNLSRGSYWFNRLKPEIDSFLQNEGCVAIIPDLRFKEYQFDEYDFIRSYDNNLIVTVSKNLADGTANPPAHESEAKNFPFFLKNSDFNLLWDSSNDTDYLEKTSAKCTNSIVEFIKN
jgi:hypothetical protein